MQIAHQSQGTVGIFARFHVHAHEVAAFGRAADQAFDVGAALRFGEVDAKLRELERDISVDAAQIG